MVKDVGIFPVYFMATTQWMFCQCRSISITIKDRSCIVSIDVAVSDHFVLYKIDDSLFRTLYPSCGHVRQDLSVLLTSVEEWSRGTMKL